MNVARPRVENTPLGLAIMVGAVMCFTMIDTSAKWLIMVSLPALQVVFARYAGHFLLSLLVLLPAEGWSALRSARPKIQLLRSLLLMGSTIFNFVALSYLPITVTTTILFAGPIVVSILSIPILGEKVGVRRMAAVVVGFCGVVIVVQPWGAEFHPAIFFSIGALLCVSLYFVLTRMLAGVETNATSQIWASGIATFCLAPFAFHNWVWPDNGLDLAVMLGIGGFGVLGHSLVTVAHRFADASVLAPVVYLQLIFATIAGLVVFGDFPTFWTFVGAAIIVSSGIYIWQRERRKAGGRMPHPPARPM